MKRRNRQGLFNGFWLDAEGERIRVGWKRDKAGVVRPKYLRIRRDEYPELYRLWTRHADIRLGVRRLGSPRRDRSAG